MRFMTSELQASSSLDPPIIIIAEGEEKGRAIRLARLSFVTVPISYPLSIGLFPSPRTNVGMEIGTGYAAELPVRTC